MMKRQDNFYAIFIFCTTKNGSKKKKVELQKRANLKKTGSVIKCFRVRKKRDRKKNTLDKKWRQKFGFIVAGVHLVRVLVGRRDLGHGLDLQNKSIFKYLLALKLLLYLGLQPNRLYFFQLHQPLVYPYWKTYCYEKVA